MDTVLERDNSPAGDEHSPAPIKARPPRLMLASTVLASPGWVQWAVTHRGLTSSVITSAILASNMVVTRRFPRAKLRLARIVQRYVLNPVVRILLSLGVLPLGLALLETTGRHSGKPRRTPVGEGRDGYRFWIVAEHGNQANYVRNLQANPHVRIRTRQGLRPKWIDGTATVVVEDDPHARQRRLCRHHPLRAINAALVRAWGTDLITIRIDFDDTRPNPRWRPI